MGTGDGRFVTKFSADLHITQTALSRRLQTLEAFRGARGVEVPGPDLTPKLAVVASRPGVI